MVYITITFCLKLFLTIKTKQMSICIVNLPKLESLNLFRNSKTLKYQNSIKTESEKIIKNDIKDNNIKVKTLNYKITEINCSFLLSFSKLCLIKRHSTNNCIFIYIIYTYIKL